MKGLITDIWGGQAEIEIVDDKIVITNILNYPDDTHLGQFSDFVGKIPHSYGNLYLQDVCGKADENLDCTCSSLCRNHGCTAWVTMRKSNDQ
jgi:hypothetical protein